MNKILIQTRTQKIPLSSNTSKFTEKTSAQLLLNGVLLFEANTDDYVVSQQELMEMMLEKSSKLKVALSKVDNIGTVIVYGKY